MFFVSGRIQANYGSTRIENVSGVLSSMPVLGTLTFIGALSLSGTPPFNIFISEFTVLKAAVDNGSRLVSGLFLLFAVLVFYGMLSGFGKILFSGKESAETAGDEHIGKRGEECCRYATTTSLTVVTCLSSSRMPFWPSMRLGLRIRKTPHRAS